MTTSIYDLRAFDRDILLTLARMKGLQSGIRIVERMENDLTGYEEINPSRLYRAMNDRLIPDGFVTKEESRRDGRSNAYRLTDHGYQQVRLYGLEITRNLQLDND